MNITNLRFSEPYSHENLGIFLIHGGDAFDGSRFISLDEAFDKNWVKVYETGNVGQLEIENLSESFDLYVQAGDIVKGGRQDRTLGVDFVLPAKSGRVPIPSFCVESGRWRKRGEEDVAAFSSSKSYLAHKKLRLAARLSKSQGEVWESVAETQDHFSKSLNKSVNDAASPSSYLLSVEDEDLLKRKETYRSDFASILEGKEDVVGYAFVINGEINSADIYGSSALFRKVWNKLLDSAILEAIAESHRKTEAKDAVTQGAIRNWLEETEKGDVVDGEEVRPRLRVETRRSKTSILFDTRDHALGDAVLHRNCVTA
jgi:hypothetical protein